MTLPVTHLYLKRWLMSPGSQSPIIVHRAGEEDIRRILQTLAPGVCEVVQAAAEGANISLESVRRLCVALSRTTFAQRRVALVVGAERLSLPAAQALLKPLEESSGSTRWLLVTSYPRRLPATIRSRCQLLRLTPASERPLMPAVIQRLAADLEGHLRTQGPSPELRLAYMRLRDYYHIVSLRGNEKQAREVALAHWPHAVI